jgi:uncharacterized protein involved in propanediol utilization
MNYNSTQQRTMYDSKIYYETEKVRGTFGELLQGQLPSGKEFLVTLPIDIQSKAIFIPSSKLNSKLKVIPESKNKVLAALLKLEALLSINIKGTLFIQSEIPEGKGLASSSADIVAALKCILNYYSYNNVIDIIETILNEIEPSDAVMYKESVFYYHKTAELGNSLGDLPSILIVGIDEGGTIDTVTHNKIKKSYSVEDQSKFKDLLSSVTSAIHEQNLYKIGEVSTKSALLNQNVAPKKFLDLFLSFNQYDGICGSVVAHSGTMIGVLIDPKANEVMNTVNHIINELIEKTGIEPMVYHN